MSLCYSCAHVVRIEGPAAAAELVYCRLLMGEGGGARILFPVRRCSEYHRRATPQLHELEEIAWRVSLDRQTQQIGFLSPLEWRDRARTTELSQLD